MQMTVSPGNAGAGAPAGGAGGGTALAAAELTALSPWGQPEGTLTVPGPQPGPAQALLAPGGTEGLMV